MYIERFQNSSKSFTRGSTPSSNTEQSKIRSTRQNKSLNKIHNKSDNQEKQLKKLQNSLIGHYDPNDKTENQNILPLRDNLNGNFRQLYMQENMKDYEFPQQQKSKIHIDNTKIVLEKQKLAKIYKQIPKNGQNSKKVDQKFKDKKQEIKSIMNTSETINSNIFKQKLEQHSTKQQVNQNDNEKDSTNYSFYDGSYYQNQTKNSTQKRIDCNNSKRNSDGQENTIIEQIKHDNIGNIRTTTSTNNMKQDNLINTSFYNNNKSKPTAIIGIRNLNQSYSNQPLNNSLNNTKKMNSQSFQNTVQQVTELNPNQLMNTDDIFKYSDKKQQRLNNRANNEILQNKNDQNVDPLNQLDELKQIITMEQQNIQQILQIGNRILQPKSPNQNNLNFKETKSSFYKKQDLSISDINKEGLLGAYEEYNKLSKHDIIEKLLVSEHIMKQLYKKTKQFQDDIQQLTYQQQNVEKQQKEDQQ